jgi:hypothetical protein
MVGVEPPRDFSVPGTKTEGNHHLLSMNAREKISSPPLNL